MNRQSGLNWDTFESRSGWESVGSILPRAMRLIAQRANIAHRKTAVRMATQTAAAHRASDLPPVNQVGSGVRIPTGEGRE